MTNLDALYQRIMALETELAALRREVGSLYVPFVAPQTPQERIGTAGSYGNTTWFAGQPTAAQSGLSQGLSSRSQEPTRL